MIPLRLRLIVVAATMVAVASVRSVEAGQTLSPGTVFRDCAECPEMVVIPPGTLERDRPEGSLFPRRITIAKPFAIGRFEGKRSEYAAFVKDTGYEVKRCWADIGTWEGLDLDWRNPNFEQDDSHPVVCVSWDAMHAYVAWLNKETGRDYRLPSSTEWELAASGGSTTAYPWGDEFDFDEANVDSYSSRDVSGWRPDARDQWTFTSPAGSFEANGYGLFDVIGNVAEWLEDCPAFAEDMIGRHLPSDGTPWVPRACGTRLTAGGSWMDGPKWTKLRSRDIGPELDVGEVSIGFRVARSLD